MTTVYLYILGASFDVDSVDCTVPWELNRDEVFFGPCKKNFRTNLRKEYLKAGLTCADVKDDIYLVGLNAGTKEDKNIVWAGKLQRVMTFAYAYDYFHRRESDDDVVTMLGLPSSPVHVKPIYDDNGDVSGYEHISEEHAENDDWIMDLVDRRKPKHASLRGKSLWRDGDVEHHKAFPRDACMLYENLSFARKRAGIPLDGEGLEVLRVFQTKKTPPKDVDRKRKDITARSPFGLTSKRTVEGYHGRQLKIDGDLGKQFAAWLKEQAKKCHPRGKARSKKNIAKVSC